MKNELDIKQAHLLALTLTSHNRGELTTQQARMVLRESGFPPHIVYMVCSASGSAPPPGERNREPRIKGTDAGNRKDLALFLSTNRRRWNLRFIEADTPGRAPRSEGEYRRYRAHCKHAPFLNEEGRATRVLSWFVSPF